MTATTPDVIEGSFRVVSTSDVARRPSPNRRRAATRIVLWNIALMAAAIALPILL